METTERHFYYNSEVFESDTDYVIAGYSSKKNGATYEEIESNLRDRIGKLIYQYIHENMNSKVKSGEKEIIKSDTIKDVQSIIEDNLHIDCFGDSISTIVDEMMESPQVLNWLRKIKFSFEAQKNKVTYDGTMSNKAAENNAEATRIKELADQTTFQVLIEELSMIDA